MMKLFAAALATLLLATGSAQAISRHNATELTCQRIQNIIAKEGAAIMRYRSKRNPSLILYDRYVRNGSFCAAGQFARSGTVPASDTPACPLLFCFQEYYPFDQPEGSPFSESRQ